MIDLFLQLSLANNNNIVIIIFGEKTFLVVKISLHIHRASYITKTCLCTRMQKISLSKTIKTSDIFHISAQNIDCGYSLEPPRRGGSNEYPQSMFLSRKKKNNVYPCKPEFYYIKVGFKGVKIIQACFRNGAVCMQIQGPQFRIPARPNNIC